MTEAYWHTRRGVWSVREGGRVIGHAPWVSLEDVTLVVRLSTVERIRLRRQREVCAWASGTRYPGTRVRGGHRISFDPFLNDAFVLDDGTPVTRCTMLFLERDGGAWIWL